MAEKGPFIRLANLSKYQFNMRAGFLSQQPFLSLGANLRYLGYKFENNFPTIFYDKVFSKSYLPFRTRHASGLVIGAVLVTAWWRKWMPSDCSKKDAKSN